MKGYHSADRLKTTNEEAARISSTSVACYFCGVLFSSLNSVRNHEKWCNKTGGAAASGGDPSLPGSSTDIRTLDFAKLGLKVLQINVRGLKAKRSELSELMRKHDVDIVCAQETLLSVKQVVSFDGYSLVRFDRPSLDPRCRVGGGLAFLIKHGISYTTRKRSFDPRDLVTEACFLTLYPSDRPSFDIVNVYRPPASNDNDSFAGGVFAPAFHPSRAQLPTEGCLVVGDFNLELAEPPTCDGEFNLGEWIHSSTLRDITDGDPTCLPPTNAAQQSTGRAIDLALLDPGAFDSRRWERLELLTSDTTTPF